MIKKGYRYSRHFNPHDNSIVIELSSDQTPAILSVGSNNVSKLKPSSSKFKFKTDRC